MKNIHKIWIGCLISLSFSCKDFLDTKPLDFKETTDYYETEDQLNYALTGVYDPLASNALYGTAFTNRMGLEADEGAYKDNTLTTGPQVYDFSSGNNYVENLWKTCYDGIGRANVLLANVNKNQSIAADYRTRIEGEALFLRGYYYFLLVINFGDVPLVLAPVKEPKNLQIKRSPAKQVYEQIIADMEKAETMVDAIRKIGYGGRVSKSAIRGILTRVCLHMAGNPVNAGVPMYAKAKYWAAKVINDTEAAHALNPDYKDIFIKLSRDEYDIKESIWEVEYWAEISGPYRELSALGGWLGIPSSNNTIIGNSYGFIQCNATLWYKYPDITTRASTDLRREWNMPVFTYGSQGQKVWNVGVSPLSFFWIKYPGKYRREYETKTPKANYQSGINYPLLRYADVLLMFAEADNELKQGALSPTDSAVVFVNRVRRRAFGNGTSIKSISLNTAGSNYTNPVVTISGGGEGKDAVIQATASTSGAKGISSLLLVERGVGYTSVPTVAITGTTGSGATATVTLTNAADADLTPAQIGSYTSFKEAIQDERSRELCFEGLRKHDLIRWGIFIPVMKKVLEDMNREENPARLAKTLAYKNVGPRHVIFPIPAREMALNKLLVQNPNW